MGRPGEELMQTHGLFLFALTRKIQPTLWR
nr:MAG TPA: hypothetical protein [Caudoviricetes sp.]